MDLTGVFVVLLIMAAFGYVAWTRQQARLASRDEIFVGLTPGMLPVAPDPGNRELVSDGMVYAGEVAVAFNPPKGVRPGLAGTIVDGAAETRDVTATIVDLAARGYLTITVVEDRSARSGRDWELHGPFAARAGDDVLEPVEQQLLADLFSAGTAVRLSTLPQTGNPAFNNARYGLWQEIHERGWMRPPTSLRAPRTAEGTAYRIQSLAFKKYLETAEADQFAYEEAAGIFGRYLPYAIVFGVAAHWTKIFGDLAARAQAEGYDDGFDIFWLSMAGWGMTDMMFDLSMLGGMDGLMDGDAGGFFDEGAIDDVGAEATGVEPGMEDGIGGDAGNDSGDSGGWGDSGGGDFGGGDFGGGDFGGGGGE
ncbi:MAG: DUF2207 domain-containing protein [Micropruina sp.]|nr:DUF2207 domain-containing protein [Micropruina sp.]